MPNTTVTATLSAIGAGHSLTAIEAALIQLFCEQRGLTPAPESTLAGILADDSAGILAARQSLAGLETLTLEDLVMAFETLVPPSEAKQYGAVFTPDTITSFMAEEAASRADALGIDLAAARVVDPAVGCAALLVAALRTITSRTGEAPHEVAGRLYGCDISKDSVSRARLLLSITCLYLGDTVEPNLTSNIVVADALLSDWDSVFGRKRFEIVLGNPPYVRFQQLSIEHREQLAARFESCGKGNYNLYFPFFEVAYELADPGGSVISLITPNAYLASMSAGLLRSWMVRTAYLEDVVDFGHHRVFDALTYTAVTFAHRSPSRKSASFRYTALDGLAGLAKLTPNWALKDSVVATWANLTSAPWNLVGKKDAAAVGKLTAAGARLDAIADVRFGVATCRDKLYLLSGEKDSSGNFIKVSGKKTYSIEAGITAPCARVSSLSSQSALDADASRIIYPYTLEDGHAVALDEKLLASNYPGAYAYLRSIRPELERRDKGNKTYAKWYAYARTQSLAPSGDKLLTPLYAASPRFLRDSRVESLFINGCSVTVKPGAPGWVTLDLLALILNSGVCHYFIESTAKAIDGGFFAYQKTQLGQLSIPEINSKEYARICVLSPGGQDRAIAKLYAATIPKRYHRS